MTSADPGGVTLIQAVKPCSPWRICATGDTFTRLACGFEIGVSTAWRCVREAVDLLAATADDLAAVMGRVRKLAYAILDGTLIPIDRVADQKPSCSGKHRRHGVKCRSSRMLPGG